MKPQILFFSNQSPCIICGKNTFVIPVCNDCRKTHSVDFETPRCDNCGRFLVSEDNLCFDCRENPVLHNMSSVFPIYSYRLWNKEILFRWKIEGQRNMAFMLAKSVYDVYQKKFQGMPVIPVPPRPKKIFKTGWDQINDLSTVLKVFFKVNVIKPLVRVEEKQQKKLNRAQRLEKIGKVYFLKNKVIGTEPPEQVVLIDDILTTGVTMESCAQALKEWGVKKVHGITLFVAD